MKNVHSPKEKKTLVLFNLEHFKFSAKFVVSFIVAALEMAFFTLYFFFLNETL